MTVGGGMVTRDFLAKLAEALGLDVMLEFVYIFDTLQSFMGAFEWGLAARTTIHDCFIY